MQTLESQISYEIAPLRVVLSRPDAPEDRGTATLVHAVENRLAVASAHGEGYWLLPKAFDPHADRPATMEPVVGEWTPHPDARFAFTVRR